MEAYSFQNTIVVVNGLEIEGWADGDDIIQIKRRVDSASDKIGGMGDMMVSVSADKSGSMVFKLQQTSPSNQYLNALVQIQEAAGVPFVPIFVKFQDTYRNDLAVGTFGYVKKTADMTRGVQGNNQEWEIIVERLDMIHGG